ncbi:hypothetical protein BT69DRAFT_1301267 [Atractiella rhizophila]|nr:hypothetical protein BT69DRAFT_1301267 [Atractiella rhizophila]
MDKLPLELLENIVSSMEDGDGLYSFLLVNKRFHKMIKQGLLRNVQISCIDRQKLLRSEQLLEHFKFFPENAAQVRSVFIKAEVRVQEKNEDGEDEFSASPPQFSNIIRDLLPLLINLESIEVIGCLADWNPPIPVYHHLREVIIAQRLDKRTSESLGGGFNLFKFFGRLDNVVELEKFQINNVDMPGEPFFAAMRSIRKFVGYSVAPSCVPAFEKGLPHIAEMLTTLALSFITDVMPLPQLPNVTSLLLEATRGSNMRYSVPYYFQMTNLISLHLIGFQIDLPSKYSKERQVKLVRLRSLSIYSCDGPVQSYRDYFASSIPSLKVLDVQLIAHSHRICYAPEIVEASEDGQSEGECESWQDGKRFLGCRLVDLLVCPVPPLSKLAKRAWFSFLFSKSGIM